VDYFDGVDQKIILQTQRCFLRGTSCQDQQDHKNYGCAAHYQSQMFKVWRRELQPALGNWRANLCLMRVRNSEGVFWEFGSNMRAIASSI
jgi:hypothetical protein